MTTPDTGLIGLPKEHLAALAHQGLGQGRGNGMDPLPCRPADQDVEINGHCPAFCGRTALIVNNYSSSGPCQYKCRLRGTRVSKIGTGGRIGKESVCPTGPGLISACAR